MPITTLIEEPVEVEAQETLESVDGKRELFLKEVEETILEPFFEKYYGGPPLSEVASQMKWNFDMNPKTSNPENIQKVTQGYLRGILAEKVGMVSGISEKCVFSSASTPTKSIEGLEVISPSLLNEKEIKFSYDKAGKRVTKPLRGRAAILANMEMENLDFLEKVQRRSIARKPYINKYLSPKSKDFDSYSLPDGLLVAKDGSIEGFKEIKGYSNTEVDLWLGELRKKREKGRLKLDDYKVNVSTDNGDMTLGSEFGKELVLTDYLVDMNATGGRGYVKDPLIVLQLPADIEKEKLIELGEFLEETVKSHSRGISVRVESLPVTYDELNSMTKSLLNVEVVKEGILNSGNQSNQYSKKHKKAISEMAGWEN